MNCKRCGSPLTVEDQYCKRCGGQIEKINTQNIQQNIQIQNKNSNKKNNIINIIFGVMAIVIVVLVVLMFVTDKGNQNVYGPDKEISYVNISEYVFDVPDSLILSYLGNTVYIADREQTWRVQLKMINNSFDDLKNSLPEIKKDLESQIKQQVGQSNMKNYKINSPEIKKINSIEYITVELTYNGKYSIVAYTQIDSSIVAFISIEKNDYSSADYTILEKISPIIQSTKYEQNPYTKISFSGCTVNIPNDSTYMINNGSLNLYYNEGSVDLFFTKENYDNLKANKNNPKQVEGWQYIGDPEIKIIDGKEFLLYKVSKESSNQKMITAYSKYDETRSSVTLVYNNDGSYNYSLLNKIAPILKSTSCIAW